MMFSCLLASVLAVSDPRADLLDLLGGEWIAQGIYVAAKLDVAHHLQKEPKTTFELGKLLQVDEQALYRVMRLYSMEKKFETHLGLC